MVRQTFACLMVRQDSPDGSVGARVESHHVSELPPGEVTIQVAWSSLNYKDALALAGHPGVVRRFPHVPGIDAAGTVVDSQADGIRPGDQVIVTGHDLGAGVWGGYSELVRVPAQWIVRLPEGLTLREAMLLGTAGFTAAQCAAAIEQHGIRPEAGPLVVTGASGGVGTLAVMILSQLGYPVTAISGKSEAHELLTRLGAQAVLDRSAVDDRSDKPLLGSRWAGAVDSVGGNILATILRSTQPRGCVAACGLAAGTDLPLTVYPFILRGVVLAGIDSAWCPRPERLEIWRRLAGPWKPRQLEATASEAGLSELPAMARDMLGGKSLGRTLVRIGASL